MNKEIIMQHIKDTKGIDYMPQIIDDIIWKKSGFDLRLASHNSEWSIDVMKLAMRLCTRYTKKYFIVGQGSGNEVAGYISFYVQGI